jgi:hypothetical protein
MKPTFALFYFVMLICTITAAKVSGQVVAIGHATAEVVESVSASSKAVTGFNLNNTTNGTALNDKVNFSTERLNLGSITINSGTNVACNLVIKSARLSDASGNNFMIDPAMNTQDQGDAARADGTQTLQINGTARMLSGQASGLYQGTYTMVFAYN